MRKTIGHLGTPQLKDLALRSIGQSDVVDICRFVQNSSGSLTSLTLEINPSANILDSLLPMLETVVSLRRLECRGCVRISLGPLLAALEVHDSRPALCSSLESFVARD